MNNNSSSGHDGSTPSGDPLYASQGHHGGDRDLHGLYGRMFPTRGRGFGHFGGRGGFRGGMMGGMTGGMMGHGPGHHYMGPSETVSLDGEYDHPHPRHPGPPHSPHPPHGHGPHPPPPPPPPPAFFDWRGPGGPGSPANPGEFDDPPVPPVPPMPPMPPRMGRGHGPGHGPGAPYFNMSDMAGLFGHHARNFYGDFMAQLGGDQSDPSHHPQAGTPEDDDPSTATAGSPHMRSGHFFGRGRGGFGFGGPRGRGGWRNAGPFGHDGFPRGPHGPHHRGEFVYPSMDIFQAGNTYTVSLELPGLTKQDVDISVKEGLLTISGELVTVPDNPSGSSLHSDDFEVMDDEAQEQLLDEFLENGDSSKNGKNNQDGDNDGKGRFLLRERQSGKFKRSLKLPPWVDVEAIKATMTEGVLKLVFEKPKPDTPSPGERKVNIL